MHVNGYVLIGPTLPKATFTIHTKGFPEALKLSGYPLEYHCGGAYCEVGEVGVDASSFTVAIECNVLSRLDYDYYA